MTIRLLPDDPFDTRLRAAVGPPEWVNPVPSGRYNLVVLGGGTAGLVSAAAGAYLGAKVALIERDLLGGDCLNVGCVPSKALLAAAKAAAHVRAAAAFGVRVPSGVSVDFPAVMARVRRLRAHLSDNDSARRFRELGVDVYFGAGRFVDGQRIAVGERTLHFHRAIIATGSRAAVPDIPGLAEAGYLTNASVFALTEQPARLAVIGAGPVGCELAQAFARLGTQVTLLGNHPRILARDDDEAAAVVAAALARDGVDLRLGVTVEQVGVQPAGEGKVLRVRGADGRVSELSVDAILLAAGRVPNVEGLDLAAAGVQWHPRHGVLVDQKLRTHNRRIFAAGDVASAYRFTHAADALARVAVQNALFFATARADRLVIPWCTYTDPELAQVGLTEAVARQQQIKYAITRLDFAQADRAITDSQAEGFVKLLTTPDGQRLLGATVVGVAAGELITQLTPLIGQRRAWARLGATIYPYPTRAEVFRKLANAQALRRLTPTVRWLLGWWMRWRR